MTHHPYTGFSVAMRDSNKVGPSTLGFLSQYQSQFMKYGNHMAKLKLWLLNMIIFPYMAAVLIHK